MGACSRESKKRKEVGIKQKGDEVKEASGLGLGIVQTQFSLATRIQGLDITLDPLC